MGVEILKKGEILYEQVGPSHHSPCGKRGVPSITLARITSGFRCDALPVHQMALITSDSGRTQGERGDKFYVVLMGSVNMVVDKKRVGRKHPGEGFGAEVLKSNHAVQVTHCLCPVLFTAFAFALCFSLPLPLPCAFHCLCLCLVLFTAFAFAL